MQQSFRLQYFQSSILRSIPCSILNCGIRRTKLICFGWGHGRKYPTNFTRRLWKTACLSAKKNPAAILPIQIAYYAGLRIGEACGLAWQDVNLEEQCLTIRRSIRYDGSKRKYIIGPTKRKKWGLLIWRYAGRDFRNARKEQLKIECSTENFITRTTTKRSKRKQSVLRILLLRQNRGSPGRL